MVQKFGFPLVHRGRVFREEPLEASRVYHGPRFKSDMYLEIRFATLRQYKYYFSPAPDEK